MSAVPEGGRESRGPTRVLGLVSVSLFLLLLEAVLRYTHLFGAAVAWSEPDEVLGHHYAPNAPYWSHLEGGYSSGFINSFGWRDIEWNAKKAPGVFRVAVVGDSFVEAFQVELPATFPKIAQDLLSRRGRRVEMMSFAQSGFTTTEELLVIRDSVLDFEPDLVALFFFPYNDIRDVSKDLAPDERPFFVEDAQGGLVLDTSFKDSKSFKVRKWINPLKRHSALVSLLATRIGATQRARARTATSRRDASPGGYLSLCTAQPDPQYLRAFSLNKRLIVEIARLVGPSRLLLATMPSPGWQLEEEAERRAEDPSFNASCFEDSLGQLAREEGFHHLGLQTVFRKDWQENHRSLYVSHWNQAGHAVVGAALAQRVEEILQARPSSPLREGPR